MTGAPIPPDLAVRAAAPGDAAAWAALRDRLWPGEAAAHRCAVAAALARPAADRLALLAWAAGAPVGLAEASLRRDHVNGCGQGPVAFLEGIVVVPAWRRRGVARRLVGEVTAWARAAGVADLASDAPLAARGSRRFHAALGFAETERVVFFRRPLAAH